MANEKISEYINTAAAIADTDLFDISTDQGGGSFRSDKITGLSMKALLSAGVNTIYTANASLAGNRQVDFNSKTLSFTGVGGFMGIGAISSGTYKLEIASLAGEQALRVNTNSEGNVLVVIDDGSNGLVGIGTSSPTIKLEVVGDSSVSGNFGIGTNPLVKFHILTTNPVSEPFIFQTVTAGADGASIFLYKHRGSVATPSATLSNDKLGRYGWQSYGTSQKDVASIFAQATQNHTAANLGTKMFFDTTENNTAVSATRLTIDHNGNIGISTTSPAQKLHVIGNAIITGFINAGSSVGNNSYGGGIPSKNNFISINNSANTIHGLELFTDSTTSNAYIGSRQDLEFVFQSKGSTFGFDYATEVWNMKNFSTFVASSSSRGGSIANGLITSSNTAANANSTQVGVHGTSKGTGGTGTTNIGGFFEASGGSSGNKAIELGFSTENTAFIDSGSTSATEQDWIEITVGGNTGYIRVFAAK